MRIMGSSGKNHPAPLVKPGEQESSSSQLWLRIAAFLSLKSRNTQRTYRGILAEWCSFLGVQFGTTIGARRFLAAVDLDAIRYKRWLEEQPGQRPRFSPSPAEGRAVAVERRSRPASDGLQNTLTSATIAKKFTALRRIYRAVIAADLGINKNPFDSDTVPISSPKMGQKRPTEMLRFEQVGELLSLPDISTPKGLRDLVVLSLLFGAGLRRSEVIKLRLGDVAKTSAGTTFVRLRATKAGRDADQALPQWAAEPLHTLTTLREKQGAGAGDFIFISYRGRGGCSAVNLPLSASGVYKLFKKYCSLAGVGAFASPHSARATAITRLLDDGIPHRDVQQFSRHASVQMVELYDKRRIGVDENPARKLRYD